MVRPLLTPQRRLEVGHYNRLMQELKVENENVFTNFVRLKMFDELLQRNGSVIQRQRQQIHKTFHRSWTEGFSHLQTLGYIRPLPHPPL